MYHLKGFKVLERDHFISGLVLNFNIEKFDNF